MLAQIEPLYAEEVGRIMAALKQAEQKKLIAMLEKIRSNISEQGAQQVRDLGAVRV